jgi:hypothetical protein
MDVKAALSVPAAGTSGLTFRQLDANGDDVITNQRILVSLAAPTPLYPLQSVALPDLVLGPNPANLNLASLAVEASAAYSAEDMTVYGEYIRH